MRRAIRQESALAWLEAWCESRPVLWSAAVCERCRWPASSVSLPLLNCFQQQQAACSSASCPVGLAADGARLPTSCAVYCIGGRVERAGQSVAQRTTAHCEAPTQARLQSASLQHT